MKSPRYRPLLAVIACAGLAASVLVSTSTAQQKPDKKSKAADEKPLPQTEKKDLLTVQPAAAPTPPDDTDTKGQKPGTKIQLPQGEADEKTPVITNTDLIT